MSTILSIDFETRSRIDLKDRGLDVYARDHSTEIICIAAGFDSGHVEVWAPKNVPNWALDYAANKGVISAWNAAFEYHIWNHVGGRLGWPQLRLTQLVDSMAIAAANNLPQDLDTAGEVTGSEFQKDKRGKKLIQLLSKPKRDGTFNEDPELLAEMFDYCKRDVQTEISIVQGLRKLTQKEQAIWVLTQQINQRGVPVDPRELDNICRIVDLELKHINEHIKQITGGIEVTKRDQLLKWFQANGLELPNMQAETIEKESKKTHDNKDIDTVLKLRSEGAKTSVTKFTKMAEVQVGGRIRNGLVYHGASTGRWASRGINLQNIARPAIWMKDQDIADTVELGLVQGDYVLLKERFGNMTMDVCSSVVRNAIKAPEGFTFVDADLSSIENRVASWIAGQNDKVELFRKGLDEYKTFASTSLYKVPYEEVTKDMRQVSKSAVLGCMFGQGAKGLVDYADGMGVVLSPAQAEEAVNAYRLSYAKVKNCWYQMGQAAVDSIKNPGQSFRAGKVMLKVTNNALWMQLPSGRLICWQRPEVVQEYTPWGKLADVVYVVSQNTFTRKWGRNKLIGSSIFQSSVQGTARDFLAEPALRLEGQGVSIINLVHDEILALSRVELANEVESLLMQFLTTPPDWAPDFPLAAESWIDTRYRK
jgi:DNA polymerase bacteriophage-type